MANRKLFKSAIFRGGSIAKARNEAGGSAYALSNKHKLAQYAATGCMNATFYASAETQLDVLLAMANKVDPEFVAKTAVYCRREGYMKDTPAILLAHLSTRDPYWLAKAAPLVLDNGRMVRNFVQIMRSGAVGRQSLGSLPKRLVRDWFDRRSDVQLFRDSIGNDPSIKDLIKMVHPKPINDARDATYAYLLGRSHDASLLPDLVRDFEAFKADRSRPLPDVPFRMLTALDLDRKDWQQIALRAGWQTTRMNLNTFARHGVFESAEVTAAVAQRLRDRELVRRSRVFPYQLLVAWRHANESVPGVVRGALHDAMEAALDNVPKLAGKVVICPDVSGSMGSPVTGVRRGSTTAVRCIDVAALTASALLRRNSDALVLPFECDVRECDLSRRGSVLRNAEKLAALWGGGTNCSAPLRWLNRHRIDADVVIFVSDNESWMDSRRYNATATMGEWQRIKQRNPQAKLICIDVQPYGTTQAEEGVDVMNVGGFSDRVFTMIEAFAAGKMNPDRWIGEIEAVSLD